MVALLFAGCGVYGWPPMPVQPTVWCDTGLGSERLVTVLFAQLWGAKLPYRLLYALNQFLE